MIVHCIAKILQNLKGSEPYYLSVDVKSSSGRMFYYISWMTLILSARWRTAIKNICI